MINQSEQDERVWNHILRFEKINSGFCPDCDEKLNDDGDCVDCHIVPSLDPEFQEWLLGQPATLTAPPSTPFGDLVYWHQRAGELAPDRDIVVTTSLTKG